jgi:membrane associated rhomboid family serine protease
VKGSHVLCLAFFVAFIVMAIGAEAPWSLAAVEALGLGDARALVERPWTLFTYPLLHRDPLEAVLVAGLLLLAGAPVEERQGTRRFLAIFAATTLFVGLAHVALVEAGIGVGRVLTGALGPACGLLTAHLFAFGHERRAGLPLPAVYLVASSSVLALVLIIHHYGLKDSLKRAEERERRAWAAESVGPDERVEALLAVGAERRLRADQPTHLLGLTLGGAAVAMAACVLRVRERYKVLREIRGLQEEVEARARVEQLLEKISKDGMQSLSYAERRFLRYASRFYSARNPIQGVVER